MRKVFLLLMLLILMSGCYSTYYIEKGPINCNNIGSFRVHGRDYSAVHRMLDLQMELEGLSSYDIISIYRDGYNTTCVVYRRDNKVSNMFREAK